MKELIFSLYQKCDRKSKEQFVKYMLDIVNENVLSDLWHFASKIQ